MDNQMCSNSDTACQQNANKISGWVGPAIVTTTLLGLLLPLSFLLLARLSIARYLLSLSDDYPTMTSISPLCTLFLYTKPTILRLLVSLLSLATLTVSLLSLATLARGLTVKVAFIRPSVEPVARPALYTAWVLLCTISFCVGLGIEGSTAAGIDGLRFGETRSLLCRVIFFLGLNETMLFWSRNVVKPVVDDTVFGCWREEKWVEKLTMTCTFGGLWWWRLRDEVEPLVVVVEIKRKLMMSVGVADFLGWWLYYLTVTIGIIRVVKSFFWVVSVFLCRKVHLSTCNDEKV